MMRSFLLLLLTVVPQVVPALRGAACSNEFDACHVETDCCKGFSCIILEQDEYVIRSNCLSKRSAQLEALPRDQKIELLVEFYDTVPDVAKRKSREQVEKFVDDHVRSFSRIVWWLERHYKIPVATMKYIEAPEL
ncbi:expressed unknown protein [Seminavis robusta]|uniref:Uncharacterized protein n=1 Tax=Seminavis robusta TaxID=568900 RepID=A0A9N8E9E0_9STRA|nr:expressed unknown protein [Seminavis robusta]|eukprot:Sro836_g209060.1 n/a (135) ;mRNA; f:37047-37451